MQIEKLGNEKMKVAVLGAGYWGKNLVRVFSQLGVLSVVCDSDTGVLKEMRGLYQGLVCTTDYNDILKDSSIKVVAIATPAESHFILAKAALLAGKDLFIEKPLAMVLKEGEELVGLAKKRNKILMVGHILYYHPAVIKLKQLVEQGVIGKIQYIYSNRLNIGRLRTQENILWSFAPHDISAMLMFTGEPPLRVSSFGEAYLNKKVYDTTLTTLEFKNGIKGHIFVSWLHPFKEQKLVIVGSKAMAVFDDMAVDKLFLYFHKIEWKEGRVPVAHKADYEIVPVEKKEPLMEELRHFLCCVAERKDPHTDGLEGVRVLKILNMCEESLCMKK